MEVLRSLLAADRLIYHGEETVGGAAPKEPDLAEGVQGNALEPLILVGPPQQQDLLGQGLSLVETLVGAGDECLVFFL